VLNFTELFNRLRDLGSFQAVTITSKQMRLLLDDESEIEPGVVSKPTEIKVGLTGLSSRPTFIQVSAATPERASEVFDALIRDGGIQPLDVFGQDGEKGEPE
jgi:hypothetical protein